MICKHCGKKISDTAKFCQNCGVSVRKIPENVSNKIENKKATNTSNEALDTKKLIFPVLFSTIFYSLLFTAFCFAAALFPPLLIPIVIVGTIYSRFLWEKIKKALGYIPNKDNIKKCNRCGSTNIKLYRKGYNYKTGFWGAIFGVRGAGYAGGFDANNTCCRCMNCGHDWETDYDYRLIEK